MKRTIFKKIIVGCALVAVIGSSAVFVTPQKAKAQWTDILNLVQNTLQAVFGGLTEVATTAQTLNEGILSKIAISIAKALLMELTNQVITWINSGFNGNPAFIQNPTAFFENLGDQATGAFIASNGPLANTLCSPFSLQIRLALGINRQRTNGNYGYDGQSPYSCTLSSIIQNGKNAANSTMNGFLGGDFSQGGFPAFIALTTQPQNNPNGAFLKADAQLQANIAGQTQQKQADLAQGNGFLSWETCTSNSNTSGGASAADVDDPGASDSYNATAENNPNKTCSIQTPGSAISGALQKHLDVPTEELELANSVNDIINAAFSQLISMALQKGLTALTQKSSDGSGSYLDNVVSQAEAQANQQIKQDLLSDPTLALASTTDTAQQTYTIYLNEYTKIQQALATTTTAMNCYNLLYASTSAAYGSSTIATALNYMYAQWQDLNTASGTLNSYLGDTNSGLFKDIMDANSVLNALQSGYSSLQNATDTSSINPADISQLGAIKATIASNNIAANALVFGGDGKGGIDASTTEIMGTPKDTKTGTVYGDLNRCYQLQGYSLDQLMKVK